MTVMKYTLTVGTLLLLYACKSANLEPELETLKRLQREEQEAHLTNNALLLHRIVADTLCQVKNGEVSFLTNEQVVNRFESYFSGVEFVRWEDSAEPIFVISEDATLAHVLVQKHVELIAKSDSTRTIQKTDFGWTELWRKRNGQWKLYTITSTQKESD